MAKLRGKPLPEVCRVLASALAAEVHAEGVEQCRFGLIIRKSGEKGIVLVTTTNNATERLLEFLDEQVKIGIFNNEITWRNLEENSNG
jgi:hypothetical protein